MAKRLLAALVALYASGNGLAMLLDGPGWYARVPGVVETGPYNAHFVADIGLAFITAGVAMALRAWRPAYTVAALCGGLFLAGHALLHVAGWIDGHHAFALIELFTILLPAALALWCALPDPQRSRHA